MQELKEYLLSLTPGDRRPAWVLSSILYHEVVQFVKNMKHPYLARWLDSTPQAFGDLSGQVR